MNSRRRPAIERDAGGASVRAAKGAATGGDALVRVENGYVVFVAGDRGQGPIAEVRPVTLGPSQRNEVVIESGVQEGDRLIVVGQKSVADGDHINVVGTR